MAMRVTRSKKVFVQDGLKNGLTLQKGQADNSCRPILRLATSFMDFAGYGHERVRQKYS